MGYTTNAIPSEELEDPTTRTRTTTRPSGWSLSSRCFCYQTWFSSSGTYQGNKGSDGILLRPISMIESCLKNEDGGNWTDDKSTVTAESIRVLEESSTRLWTTFAMLGIEVAPRS